MEFPFSNYIYVDPEISQHRPELILCGQAGVQQVALLALPFLQATIVVQLVPLVDDEGHDVVFQAFLEQDQPTHAAIAVLEGMDALEADMEVDQVFQSLFTGLVVIDLFQALDQDEDDRDPYLKEDDPELAAFPYVNGGLFSDENIEIPALNEGIFDLLLTKASEDFDWSEISPTIFGAVFESTLNPETRRKGGMHYDNHKHF